MYGFADEDNRDHFEEHMATPAEAMQEYACNFGMDHPERAWILTPFDTWERNPHYSGPPVPHPEDDYGQY